MSAELIIDMVQGVNVDNERAACGEPQFPARPPSRASNREGGRAGPEGAAGNGGSNLARC